MTKPNIAILGYGRFGKLLAELLKTHGNIFIIHRHQVNNKKVKQINLKEIRDMDWIIPAVPISTLGQVLKKISPHLNPGSLVMDVCSVKTLPCRWMKTILPQEVEILGSHPMFGPDSAKYGLKDLSMVFCPIRIKHSRLQQVIKIFRSLGPNCLVMDPKTHDREAAMSLSLVHFIGRALGQMNIRSQKVSTLGFERLLSVNETVTNDTWQLFHDMHAFNPYAKAVRGRYLKALDKVNTKLS
jgi:prephenate dehydrogenase